MNPGYPFSAIVGQDRLLLALSLCAVHPGIGGVLVRGEKGTAKSTAVRALTALMPPVTDSAGTRPARLVELPVGATEDRVVGSIDFERIVRDGERAFTPGLLASADRGLLYVDEVNLLHDHLVDLLLDAAAMGRVHVERDGISHSYPSTFVLVGTMNPEEGELRPQLLDRFGLAVDVSASRDVDTRMTVVRRRLDYERDAEAFAEAHADADAEIAARIAAARDRVADVELPDSELRRIAAVCAAFDVDGMRGDLVVARTATAHAAWRGGTTVTEDDVRVAVELALPHRRRRDPFDAPGLADGELDDAMSQADEDVRRSEPEPDPDPDPDGGGAPDPGAEDGAPEPSSSDDAPSADEPPPPPSTGGSSGTAASGDGFDARLLQIDGVGDGAPGRRSRARVSSGRVVRATDFTGGSLHLVGTLMRAAERRGAAESGRLSIAGGDLRGVDREGREGNLIVFVVDASGSMAARDRLSAVTGAVVSLLRDAYRRRDRVAVVSVRGSDAEVILPPTRSVDVAVTRLRDVRTGGRTPLASGFLTTRDVIARERVREPGRRALVVTLTDGRATGGPDPVGRARQAAALLAADKVASVVVDCESGMVRLGLARDLATALRGTYISLPELSSASVAGVVRAAA
ncbi:VWA domain-containing protein [Rhodococcus sp. BP-349]|uniref:VWA domain-containing protein n=1 Tax=unclassified Rhodococcus (in: high G+C Gram-positive bacteria) TaxID=192944 RepID=UPI001C9AEDAC|nr:MULTISPECIES: VWA domain-containing protein [unclassified Rhodococcus (in: high G+C Gram-positive bacteria)]MBY6540926.1 VWA domain-containing protein [Rhodococcus sp. BP-363]MBY6545048.1 VWA domain-containing protein [Rhodococcus sp. BP-369]MBY6564278.1 VWA domain-containing protein [Rhodococcus sp. BP-370]MBY6578785.1 VWA domain-containing protein [Rhodococcus sp. BP-364]MBY6588086.1 VWA domain-containing protein [Rhodococcus sp. BP-358]